VALESESDSDEMFVNVDEANQQREAIANKLNGEFFYGPDYMNAEVEVDMNLSEDEQHMPKEIPHQQNVDLVSESESDSDSDSEQENVDVDSESSDSDSEEETALQLDKDEAKKPEEPFPAWMDGFGGYNTYIRDIPDRFEEENSDTLMWSLYKNYATEGRKNGKPTGHFWVTKTDAQRAAEEVAVTHLGAKSLTGDLKTQFNELWDRYDVNEDGHLDIDRMPQFLRTFCGNNEACIGLQ
jgi:hypothetical protein